MSTQRGRRHSLLLRVLRAAAATAACVTAAAGPAPAQPARADYERALGLREAYQKAAVGIAGPATWIGKTGRFWYRRSVEGGHEFLVVDAATRARERAFDHDAVAAALGRATGGRYTGVTLPFQRIEFAEDGRRLEVRVEGTLYRCALAEPVSCQKVEPPAGAWGGPGFSCVASTADRPLVSPDGAWEAFVQNYNVAVRPRPAKEAPKTPDTVTLSTDGSEGQCYAPRSIVWSPDSTRIAAYRVTPGHRREVHYIESSPEDQLQPKHSTRFYAKPGDVLDIERPVLFHVPTARRIDVDSALFPHAFDMSPLVWRKDGRAVTFEYNQRGHQVYRVIEVSAETGAARAVVDERAATFFNYSGKKFRHDVDDGREVVWMSERDGWNHLYLYDGATGTVRQQITSGSWPVREVLKVDEQARRIWFTASGVRDGVDPYFLDAYRIDFDGGHLVRLTEGDLNHAVSLSDDGQWLVDTASRVDVAPTMTLRRGEDGELSRSRARETLARCAARAAAAGGVRRPGSATGRPALGVICRPSPTTPRSSIPSSRTSTRARSRPSCPSPSRPTTRCRRRPNSASSCKSDLAWAPRIARRRFTTSHGRTSRTRGSPTAFCGTRRRRAATRRTTSHGSASTAPRPGARVRWGPSSSTPSSTRSPCRPWDATTTAWTRSGGTSSGWDGRSARTTPSRRTS